MPSTSTPPRASDAVVRLEVRDEVATVTLDSPGNRNALSRALRTELAATLDQACSDPGVRVVVLTHSGGVFCAGIDLAESLGADADAQSVHEFPALLARITSARVPVIARVAGAARGGGVGLVAACDIVLAAEDASFAFSEVRFGLVPAVASTTVLNRVERRGAHELFLTGEPFDAARAERIGLVNRVVPSDALDPEVARYVQMLRCGGPEALRATKTLLADSAALPRHERSRTELVESLPSLSATHFASDEGQEGLRAFAERRAAAWAPSGGG